MKRKLVSLLLVVALCVVQVSPVAAASSLSVEEELTLIASDMIEVTHLVTESGAMQTTYSNLDVFIAYAKRNCDVSDYDLARFVMEYTEQYYSENLPEATVLEALDCSDVFAQHETVYVAPTISQTGIEIMPLEDWTTPDIPIIFRTVAVKMTVESETYYVLTGMAMWKECPNVLLRDSFVLTCNATFDNTYNEAAYFEHKEYCTMHNHALRSYLYIDKNNPVDNENGAEMSFSYQSGYPGVLFDTWVLCDQASNYTTDPDQSEMTVYIRYRVKPTKDSHNVQAAYSHKSFGIGDISWSLGVDGLTPSFSLRGTKDDYFARPIAFP